MPYKTQKVISILFTIAATSSYWCSCSSREPEKKTDNAKAIVTYCFLDNLNSARIISENPVNVRKGRLSINYFPREVLFQHPDTEVIFENVGINDNAQLDFGIGISPTAWDKPGDGVLFEISVIDEKAKDFTLFSKYIDPKKNTGDKKWFDEQLSLSALAGQKVTIIFKTNGGPARNRGNDFAVWSNPQIIKMQN